jgi:hypothetical protein
LVDCRHFFESKRLVLSINLKQQFFHQGGRW